MFVVHVLAINLALLILTECLLYDENVHILPQIVKQPVSIQYAFEGDEVILPCEVQCNNCTKKVKVIWFKNDVEIKNPMNSITFQNTTLIIKNYTSNLHNGSYWYKAVYHDLVIRSISCSLRSARLPLFSISSINVSDAATAFFKCIDSDSSFTKDLEFRWYKDKKLLRNGSSFHFTEEFLLIDDVQDSDIGHYKCCYKFKHKDKWYNSSVIFLNVTKDVLSSPGITYFSKNRVVLYNSSVTIPCVSTTPNTVVRIFKVSKDGDTEMNLVERRNYAILHIPRFTEGDANIYICEAQLSKIRAKKDIVLDIAEKPELDHDGVTHVSTKSGNDISFSCKPKGSVDATVTWYQNGEEIKNKHYISLHDSWLTVSHVQKVSHGGIYQCFVRNQYGSDTKMFYMTVGDAGLAPEDLQVIKIDLHTVKLTWKASFLSSMKPKTVYFKISWSGPDGITGESYTMKNELPLPERVYGGFTYIFEVCTLYTLKTDVKDCTFKTESMEESLPIQAPRLKRPLYDSNVLKVSWDSIPRRAAMGMIQNYTIFYKQFYGYDMGTTEIFHVHGNKTEASIYIKGKGSYRVWMVGTNNVGSSPKSQTYIFSTDYSENEESPEIDFSVEWKISLRRYNPIVRWELLKANDKITQFRIFYVEIPYINYWKSVKTITVDKSVRSYIFTSLDVRTFYRFTIAPIYESGYDRHERRYNHAYGKLRHAILHQDNNYIKTIFESKIRVNSPTSLNCLGIGYKSLLISWNPPKTNYIIQSYLVFIKGEKRGDELVYRVRDTHIALHNLTEIWYAVRVQAHNEDLIDTVAFYQAGYLSCTTKIKVPTKPQNVDTMIVLYKEIDRMLLIVKWKPPVYTGDSIYNYIVRMREHQIIKKGQIAFPFENNYYNVLMDTQYDDYVYSQSIDVKGVNIYFELEVTPENTAGRGASVMFKSKAILNHPKRTKGIDTQLTTTIKPNSDDSHIELGIVVGLATSAIFFVIFVVACIVKEPCKRDKTLSSAYNDERNTYLYLQRLREVPSMSSQRTLSTTNTSNRTNSKSVTFSEDSHSYSVGNKLHLPFGCGFLKRCKRRDDDSIVSQQQILLSSPGSCNCNSKSTSGGDHGPLHCPTCQYGSSASEERESNESNRIQIHSLSPSTYSKKL